MKVKIYKSRARGIFTAPPSKSIAHRQLICAALAEGESEIKSIALSDDIKATMDCLRVLGAKIEIKEATAKVQGISGKLPDDEFILNCRQCGSTLRFFVPLCMLSGKKAVLSGEPSLIARPMTVYEKICKEQNIVFEKTDTSIMVCGKIKGGSYEIPGNISSQFVSGMMFALPLLSVDSKISLLPPVESKPYIDLTLSSLSDFGIDISQNGNEYNIRGNQKYKACDTSVEGDWSNAAFFEALNLMGGEVKVCGLDENSLQGDRVYKELFKRLKAGENKIDICNCPDLAPILFVAAAYLNGAKFVGTKRLKIKESDRATAMKEELSKFNIQMQINENSVEVFKSNITPPTQMLFGHNDHRIVMALSVLLTAFGGEIEGAEAAAKSFPDFFERLQKLGVEVEYE